jgi:hypothetical protein
MTSCQTLTNLSTPEYEIKEINNENYHELNGQYNTTEDTVFGEITHVTHGSYTAVDKYHVNDTTLHDRLFDLIATNTKYVPFLDSLTIDVNFISSRKCIVSGHYNSKQFFKRKLKGEIKGNYFYVKPKFLLFPIPFCYLHRMKRTRIGKTKNNDLIVDQAVHMWFWPMIMAESRKGCVTSIYKRKE